jgi:hypothetical protein
LNTLSFSGVPPHELHLQEGFPSYYYATWPAP